MTAPVMPQPVQPMQPPQPPQSPFPVRANDSEPPVAMIYMRRLSKLLVEPKFTALQLQHPEWAQQAVDAYNRAMQAVQAAMPAPPLPKGVVISDKVTGGDIGAEEQAATHPNAPKQAGPPKPPGVVK